MNEQADALIENWKRRNISGFFCRDKQEALDKVLGLVPPDASVGFSGSVSLGQLGVIAKLKERGNEVFDPYQDGLSRQESLALRREAVAADCYLASANAVASSGELVFFSAWGNRTAGVAYARNLILVCGVNKITDSLSDAIKRAREYATPLNCQRLKDWHTPCLADGNCRRDICMAPEYRRMCCQVLIIEAEAGPGRLAVILVGEKLGF